MELFHTLNRGVDKRQIFLDDRDYLRFIHNLYEFNDKERVLDVGYRFKQSSGIINPLKIEKKRKLIVDIHCFCLMGNHYHLLLSPRVENGIFLFMKKLNMGYAKYFNNKYKRTGALFEGRYKSVPITTETHFVHIPHYIHMNPLDFISPQWRNGKIKDPQTALKFLENYRWSSFLDFVGKKNFPSITSRKFLLGCFGGEKKYRTKTLDWLKDLDLIGIEDLMLE